MNIGLSIKRALEVRNITRSELAQRLDCSNAYITQLTRSEKAPSLAITKLCRALDMRVSAFLALGDEGHKPVISKDLMRDIRVASTRGDEAAVARLARELVIGMENKECS